MNKEELYLGIPLLVAVLAGQQLRQDSIENNIHTFTNSTCQNGQIMYGNAFTGHHLYEFSPDNEKLKVFSFLGDARTIPRSLENEHYFEKAHAEREDYCNS